MAPVPPEPNERERELARWVYGEDVAVRDRFALYLARYREELLAAFVEMRVDYDALGDRRVAEELHRIITLARGEPH